MSYRAFWNRRFIQAGAVLPGLNPNLSTFHGLGIDPIEERYLFSPHPTARVIIVDGTTSNSGQIYRAATVAAGKALMRPGPYGDWLLFPEGGVSTTLIGEWPYLYVNPTYSILASGIDANYPALIGTFDPTDPTNPAKWNSREPNKFFKFDARGKGRGTGMLYDNRSVGGHFRAVVNIYFEAGLRDETSWVGMINRDANGVVYDGCVFDRVFVQHQTAGGTVNTGIAVPDWDRTPLLKNITFNRCGFLYHNSSSDGRQGNTFESGISYLSYQSCVNHHGGWSEDHTRDTPEAYYQKALVMTGDGVKTVFSMPTLKAHTANMTGSIFAMSAKNASSATVAYTEGTDYTVSFTRTDPITTGFTVTFAVPLPAGYTFSLTPMSAGPDIFKHNWYIGATPDGVRLYNNIGSWDSCNAKWASGLFYVTNHTEVHSPMGFIWVPYNGAPNKPDWPENGRIECDGYLQLGVTRDLNRSNGLIRGHGPWITNGGPGTFFKNGVMLSNNGVAGVNGIDVTAADGCTSTAVISDTIFAEWRFAASELTPTATNTTRFFERMIWDEPTAGTNVNRATMTNTTMRNAIAQCLLLNVHTTFRIEQNIPVTVDADDLVTEDRVLAYMARNPTLKHWNKLLRAHMLSPLGRS